MRRIEIAHIIALLCTVLRVFWTETARAETATVGVIAEGPGAQALRTAVVRSLPEGLTAVDAARLRLELVRAGLNRGTGKLDANTTRRLRRAASAVGADAVVVARVEYVDARTRQVRLAVLDVSADLVPLPSVRLGAKPSDKDAEDLAAALRGALDRFVSKEPADEPPAPPPPADEPVLADEPVVGPNLAPTPVVPVWRASEATSTPSVPSTLAATSTVDVSIAGEVVGRFYTYDNSISRSPYVYRLTAVPGGRISGNVYPFAATTRTVAADLGITFDCAGIALTKADLNGADSFSNPTSYALGLRSRARLGSRDRPRVTLGLSIEYAVTKFSDVGPASARLPGVAYRTLRPALGARLHFGRLAIVGEGAVRFLPDPASTSPRFPNPRGYGFDGSLGPTLTLTRHLEARLIARFERYALRIGTPPGTTFRGGAVTDTWYGAGAALALLL